MLGIEEFKTKMDSIFKDLKLSDDEINSIFEKLMRCREEYIVPINEMEEAIKK